MKILLNKCFGGFSLTEAVYVELGIPWNGYGYLSNDDLDITSDNMYSVRADDRLIAAVEKLGLSESSGNHADLVIVDIDDDITSWDINEYDGIETVHEDHRSW